MIGIGIFVSGHDQAQSKNGRPRCSGQPIIAGQPIISCPFH